VDKETESFVYFVNDYKDRYERIHITLLTSVPLEFSLYTVVLFDVLLASILKSQKQYSRNV
jgi:hypothetical protein